MNIPVTIKIPAKPTPINLHYMFVFEIGHDKSHGVTACRYVYSSDLISVLSLLDSLYSLSPLTLLIFGQLHRAVDVGGHLPHGEATILLVPVVGVVAL